MRISREDEKQVIEQRKQMLKLRVKDGGVCTVKHFKGNFYEVFGVVEHTETHEELVVYRGKYDNRDKVWVRPIDMFLSYLEEKDEDNYDATYRMTFDMELEETEEQVEQARELEKRISEVTKPLFAKNKRGEIYQIVGITRMEMMDTPEHFVSVFYGGGVAAQPQNLAKMVPAKEFFTDNFEVVEGVSHHEYLQASQLSQQIQRAHGWV